MEKEARYYEKLDERRVQCHLCPHECVIADGRSGFCNFRNNVGGTLVAGTYGRPSAIALDPIEKKPLYHFHPGTQILSIGTMGCTFHCNFCQNWHMLRGELPARLVTPEQLVEAARREKSIAIAYTYNEPYVSFEYVLDTAKVARQAGLKNVLVTNGYYMPEPFAELGRLVDAMNIDLKGIREEFYKEYSRGELWPVQRTIEDAVQRGIMVELTNLLIPGANDSEQELRDLVDYVAGLGKSIPLHFSRYHPAYKLDLPPTPASSLERAYRIASEKLNYVYLGNVSGMQGSDTNCPQCGAVAVRRTGCSTRVVGLEGSSCRACGAALNFVV